MRRLATIQKIVNISPIQGADKIEVAQVLGWECVVAKKDNFKIGDLIIYIEIDSIVPEIPSFEFLRQRKFRVKTIKLKNQVSQGLVVPVSMLPTDTPIIEDSDVTDMLGIKKYDPQIQEEKCEADSNAKRSKIMKYLMNIPAFRKAYLYLNSKEKGNWPNWITKTDEIRIQTSLKLILNDYDKPWYATEKLDGQSGTFFTFSHKVWGFNRKSFGVCSRNIWLKTPNDSTYWNIANKYDLKNKLISYSNNIGANVIIQGEILAPKVQGNKYAVSESCLYVFNILENNKRLPYNKMIEKCKELGLNPVPIIHDNFIPSQNFGNIDDTQNIVKKLVEMSEGKSTLYDVNREGLVWRLIENPEISLKVINPKFLLENEN